MPVIIVIEQGPIAAKLFQASQRCDHGCPLEVNVRSLHQEQDIEMIRDELTECDGGYLYENNMENASLKIAYHPKQSLAIVRQLRA